MVFRGVLKISKSDLYLRHVCLSVCLSAWNNSASTGRRFMKFDIWGFFENLPRTFKFDENLTRMTGTWYEDLCRFMLTSQWIFLGWEMFQTKIVVKIKADILCLVTCLRKSYHLWDNVEIYGRARQATGGNTIRRKKKKMGFAGRIPKARIQTHIHNVYYFLLFYCKNLTRTRLCVTLHLHCLSCSDCFHCEDYYYRGPQIRITGVQIWRGYNRLLTILSPKTLLNNP